MSEINGGFLSLWQKFQIRSVCAPRTLHSCQPTSGVEKILSNINFTVQDIDQMRQSQLMASKTTTLIFIFQVIFQTLSDCSILEEKISTWRLSWAAWSSLEQLGAAWRLSWAAQLKIGEKSFQPGVAKGILLFLPPWEVLNSTLLLHSENVFHVYKGTLHKCVPSHQLETILRDNFFKLKQALLLSCTMSYLMGILGVNLI